MRTLTLCLLCLFAAVVLPAQSPDAEALREAAYEQPLKDRRPDLLDTFRQAQAAQMAQQWEEAARLYGIVHAQMPDFDVATRRLGYLKVWLGKDQEGIALCEEAVRLNRRSSENLASLAFALATPSHGKASRTASARALDLLLKARDLPHGMDADNLIVTAQQALRLERMDDFRQAVRDLRATWPDRMETHYCSGIEAAIEERWTKAEAELLQAERLGLPHQEVQRLLDAGIHRRVLAWRIVKGLGWSALAWALGLGLLFLAGWGLSRWTLRRIARAAGSAAPSPEERRIRAFYRQVIRLAGVYYYLSLPMVALLVLGLAAGAVYLCLMLGRIPVKLLLILILGALATVWALLRSLFLKVEMEDPGRALAREEAPGLWALTEEVARALATRPIDEIRITAGTELAVYERGSRKEKRENRAQRILILGAGVLEGFRQGDFRAVLAHEYGHFSNRDTAGGDVAFRVQRDLVAFFRAIVAAGQATWINAAVHFLRIYDFIFRRITHGATRLQEVLADRVAAQAFGAPAFEGGLKHVIRRSVVFAHAADQEIGQALENRRPLENLYELPASVPEEVESRYREALNRPTTDDDTHPCPMDRFRFISAIPSRGADPRPGMVWDLFRDREKLTREITETIEDQLDRSIDAGQQTQD